MTYFTSGKISHDPEPYVGWRGAPRFPEDRTDGLMTYDPRPEFEHNNPILVAFRESRQLTHLTCTEMADLWVETERARPWTDYGTPEEIDHARRVLTKLANLS